MGRNGEKIRKQVAISRSYRHVTIWRHLPNGVSCNNLLKKMMIMFFFARCLVSCPPQHTVYMEQKKSILGRSSSSSLMSKVFKNIYTWGYRKLKLSAKAKVAHHDDIADYKKHNSGNSFGKSLMSKSWRITMRLACVMCIIWNALQDLIISDAAPQYNELVTEIDFKKGKKHYSI